MKKAMSALTVLMALFCLPPSATARNGPDRSGDETYAGPALGVARISVTDGDVRVRRGESGDEIRGRASMALVGGDSIFTGPRSRAEVQLDHANFIRLGQQTELRIGELGNRRFQVEVLKGLVNYSQLRGGEADVDLETGQVTVRPLKKGVYRVEFGEGGQTTITVREGAAEVASSRGVEKLKKGRRMAIRGDAPDAQLRTAKAAPKDSFDQWNKRRDKLLKRDRTYRGWGYPPFYPHYAGFGYGHYWGPGFYYGPRLRTVVAHRGVRGRGGRRR